MEEICIAIQTCIVLHNLAVYHRENEEYIEQFNQQRAEQNRNGNNGNAQTSNDDNTERTLNLSDAEQLNAGKRNRNLITDTYFA